MKKQVKKQIGFTLVELIIVVLLVGILSAIAVPHFVSLTADARIAKLKSAMGAIHSAVTMVHAKHLLRGTAGGALNLGGGLSLAYDTEISNTGMPLPAAFKNGKNGKNIAGLDAKDFVVDVEADTKSGADTAPQPESSTPLTTTTLKVSDASKTTCYFTVELLDNQPPKFDTDKLKEESC